MGVVPNGTYLSRHTRAGKYLETTGMQVLQDSRLRALLSGIKSHCLILSHKINIKPVFLILWMGQTAHAVWERLLRIFSRDRL